MIQQIRVLQKLHPGRMGAVRPSVIVNRNQPADSFHLFQGHFPAKQLPHKRASGAGVGLDPLSHIVKQPGAEKNIIVRSIFREKFFSKQQHAVCHAFAVKIHMADLPLNMGFSVPHVLFCQSFQTLKLHVYPLLSFLPLTAAKAGQLSTAIP